MGSFQLREQLSLPVATMALLTEVCFCGAAIPSDKTLATRIRVRDGMQPIQVARRLGNCKCRDIHKQGRWSGLHTNTRR